ncbi:FAD-binding protein [Secundilactobacillus kimchicus]|uniref:FAD-binding protein n=1 Tax=Secundilactobacillus kimchicus TaxID=528209 RepID=UPI0031F6C725
MDSVLVKDIAKHAPENIEWLAEMGISWQSVYGANHLPLVDEADMADRIHVYDNGKGGGGQMGDGLVLTQTLLAEAQKAGAVLSLDSPTVALIQDTQKRRIYGVAVDVAGTRQNIEATRGVILATAGIDHNLELAQSVQPATLCGSPTAREPLSKYEYGRWPVSRNGERCGCDGDGWRD